jgi:hypothetical protein
MLRIQRSANGRVVFKLSGRIEAEDIGELAPDAGDHNENDRILARLENPQKWLSSLIE